MQTLPLAATDGSRQCEERGPEKGRGIAEIGATIVAKYELFGQEQKSLLRRQSTTGKTSTRLKLLRDGLAGARRQSTFKMTAILRRYSRGSRVRKP